MFGEIIGSVVGGLLGNKGQEDANAASAESAQAMMDFQERMSNTAYQRGMADMKKAGLNPMLAFMKGGASTPSGSLYTAQNEQKPLADNVSQLAPVVAQVRNVNANTEKAKADTVLAEATAAKSLAEKQEIEARTPTHTQAIELSKAQQAKIEREANHVLAQHDLTNQQTHKVMAEINNLVRSGNLIDAQTRHVLAQAGLTQAQIAEVEPRINKLIADAAYTKAGTDLQQTKSDLGNLLNVPAAGELINSAGSVIGENIGKHENTLRHFFNSAKQFVIDHKRNAQRSRR